MLSRNHSFSKKTFAATVFILSFYLGLVEHQIQAAAPKAPNWIWSSITAKQAEPKGGCQIRKIIELKKYESVVIDLACDNRYQLIVNGRHIGQGKSWNVMDRYDVTKVMKTGNNIILVRAINDGGPAGFIARVNVKDKSGNTTLFLSDATWLSRPIVSGSWKEASGKAAQWLPSHVYGPLGKTAPWNDGVQLAKKITVFKQMKKLKRPPGKFRLINGDRVVMLGSTMIERSANYGYVESALTAAFSQQNITFRNLGWSGDNVFARSRAGFGNAEQGFRELTEHIYTLQPTVILLNYGANASYQGENGIDEFETGMRRLLQMLDKTRAEIVFLSPTRQENLGKPLPDPAKFNKNRLIYAKMIQQIAKQRGNPYIDLYHLLGPSNDQVVKSPLTDNGIHFNQYGYWCLANTLRQELGGKKAAWEVLIVADKSKQKQGGLGTTVRNVQLSAESVKFETLDQSLPQLNLPKDSPSDARQKIAKRLLRVTGLQPGRYQLTIDSQANITADAKQWEKGMTINSGPEFQQIDKLQTVVNRKNKLYFYRWRPQNNTYLFLFRKHEQGNNAREIPMFDPLILAKEKEIANLRIPQKHTYQLKKVSVK